MLNKQPDSMVEITGFVIPVETHQQKLHMDGYHTVYLEHEVNEGRRQRCAAVDRSNNAIGLLLAQIEARKYHRYLTTVSHSIVNLTFDCALAFRLVRAFSNFKQTPACMTLVSFELRGGAQ